MTDNQFDRVRRLFQLKNKGGSKEHPTSSSPLNRDLNEKRHVGEAAASGLTVWFIVGPLWKGVLAFLAVFGMLQCSHLFWDWWKRVHLEIPVLKGFHRVVALMVAMMLFVPVAYGGSLLYDMVFPPAENSSGTPSGPVDPTSVSTPPITITRDCDTHPMDCPSDK